MTRLLDWWFAPVEPARLALFARVFSCCFLYWYVAWLGNAREWLTAYGFHLTRATTGSTYPSPFPLVPEAFLWPFVIVTVAVTLLAILDVGGRPLKFLMLALAIYLQLVDQVASFTLNKLFIYGYAVIAFAPTPRLVTVEGSPRLRMSAWPVRTFQATLMIQYVTAGWCKILHGDWLYRPDILMGHSAGLYRTEIAGWVVAHAPRWFWPLLSWQSLAFECGVVILFVFRRTRPIAYLWGLAFHLGIAVLMKDLIYFSVQMNSFYLVFISGERAARWNGAVERWVARGLASFVGPARVRPA